MKRILSLLLALLFSSCASAAGKSGLAVDVYEADDASPPALRKLPDGATCSKPPGRSIR